MSKGSRMLRNITAASRTNPESQAKSPRENAAMQEAEERNRLFGTCVNPGCKNGENRTRKKIFGAPHGRHGDEGTCCGECEKEFKKIPKYPDHPEEDYIRRLAERGITI